MIDDATLDDLPALCRLLGELFEQEADFRPDPAKQSAGLRLILENPQIVRILVMREEGSVRAMVSLLATVDLCRGGLAWVLEDLIVQREYRGRGIAGRLIAHALDFARAQGAVEVRLLTDAVNHRAIALYEKLGFTRQGDAPMRCLLLSKACHAL